MPPLPITETSPNPRRVVITGIGMVTPLGLNSTETWNNLISGNSGINPITSFDAENFETRIAAEIQNFDPTEFMDPKEARRNDRFSQFAISASIQAMDQAGLVIKESDAAKAAVIIGSGIGGILTISEQFEVLHQKGPSRISPFLVTKMLVDMASGQVSIKLGAKGPNYSTVTACASGSDAIGHGFELIRRNGADVVIAGGTEASICPIAISGFSAAGALSRRNDNPKESSRPFDAARDGFVMGEGSAILVIENLQSALERGANPIAEIIGYGSTSDSLHITQPHPDGQGGANAMRLALQQGNIMPSEIDYINAHGTSTPLNDRAETQAIKSVFQEDAYKIPISSTKSMTGHLMGAAGALEAAICALSIENGLIHPTINLFNPDPDCDLNYTSWTPIRGPVNTALSNSLGFGGHNSSLILRKFKN